MVIGAIGTRCQNQQRQPLVFGPSWRPGTMVISGIEQRPQGYGLHPWPPAFQLSHHLIGERPKQIRATTQPIAAKAKAPIQLGATGDAAQLGPQHPFGQGEMASVGVGVGRNQQIRAELPQLLNQITPTKQHRARFDQVFPFHGPPIELVQPRVVALNPVVEGYPPAIGGAGALQHLLHPNLDLR